MEVPLTISEKKAWGVKQSLNLQHYLIVYEIRGLILFWGMLAVNEIFFTIEIDAYWVTRHCNAIDVTISEMSVFNVTQWF